MCINDPDKVGPLGPSHAGHGINLMKGRTAAREHHVQAATPKFSD